MSKSPKPNRFEVIALCDFPDAMRAVIDGKQITKQSWGTDSYAMLRNAELQIHLIDEPNLEDGWHVWKVSEGDMIGEDWVIL